MTTGRKNKVWPETEWLGIGLLTLAAAALRFYQLGRESLWVDEAASWFASKGSLGHLLQMARTGEANPPLHHLILWAWQRIFGDGEVALRGLSVILGALAVPVLYSVARPLLGRTTAWIGALLLAVSPVHFYYSQEARMYTLFTLLIVLCTWTLGRAWRRGRVADWLLYALTATAALYTHYFTVFFLAAQAVAIAISIWHGHKRDSWRKALAWVAALTGVGLLFLPWMPSFVYQLRGGSYLWNWVAQVYGKPGLNRFSDLFTDLVLGFQRPSYPPLIQMAALWLYVMPLGLAAWGIGRRLLHTPRNTAGEEAHLTRLGWALLVASLCVPPLVAWLVSQVRPVFVTRYLLPTVPFFLLLVAFGVAQLKDRRAQIGLTTLLVTVAGMGLWNEASSPHKQDWRGTVDYVLSQAKAGDLVVVESVFVIPDRSYDYYARGRLSTSLTLPSEGSVRPPRVWFIEVSPSGSPNKAAQEWAQKALYERVHDQTFRGLRAVLYEAKGDP